MMEQPKINYSDDAFEKKYQTRPGTKEFGRLYETKVAALLSLRCAKTVNMWMANNADDIGDFDDVLLFKEATKGQYIVYMIQLKHQETPKDLQPSDFTNKKDFNLSKYYRSFQELKDKIDNPKENEAEVIKYLRGAHKTFFVLYTNKGVNSCECKFLNDFYDNDLLTLTTSASGRCYTFDYTQLQEYDAAFLNQVVLLPNQCNVNNIDGIIREEMRQLTRSLSLTDKNMSKISNEFVGFIAKWMQSNIQEHHYLTKRDINIKLVHLLLNRYRMKLSEPNLTSHDFPQKCIFNEIINDKVITILQGDNKCFNFLMQYIYSEVVKFCNKDVKKYEDNLPQKSKTLLFKNYTNLKIQMIKILGSPENITFLDVYTCMWLDNQIPLLLKTKTAKDYKTIVKIFERFDCNLRVILLNKTRQPMPKTKTHLKRFESLGDLDKAYRDVVLNRQVKLQGRPSVLLASLVGNDKSMYQYITADHIISILLNDFNIGNVYESPSDYYIERRLYRILINPEVLKNINTELFLIEKPSGLNYKFLHINETKICNLDNTKNANLNVMRVIKETDFSVKNVIIVENHEGLQNIQNNIHTTSGKSIHWLKFLDTLNLEWKASLGSTNNIKLYEVHSEGVDDHRPTYTLKDISQEQNSTHILSASPGMGKSTLMDCLAHRALKNMWILNINLNQHKEYYKQLQNSNIPASTHLEYFSGEIFEKHNCSTKLVKAVFKKFLDSKKVLVILDGFDEISIWYKREVTNIAKCLQEEGYQIWLTTRPFVKSYLEQELNSISMTLKPFTPDDQKTFLIKYFTQNRVLDEKGHHIIKQFSEKLLKAAAHNLNDKSYQFMGIPLQTQLLADAFNDECLQSLQNNIIQFNKNFDLLDLYEKFITVKTEILHKKYSNWHETVHLIANYTKIRSFCALKMLFDESHLRNLNIETEVINFKNYIFEGAQLLLTDGIMVTENEFVHRSFAEYISAKWLAENLNNQDDKLKNTIEILLRERFNYQQKFMFNIFDRILSKNCPIHAAVINGRFDEAVSVIRTSMDQTFSEDELGRSPLHILALYGDYDTYETSNDYSTNSDKESKSRAVNIAKLLLNDKTANLKNDKLGYNPLDYAIAARSFAIANEICAISSNLNVKVDFSLQSVDRNTPLHIAAGEGYVHLVYFLISKKSSVESVGSNGDTALHKAVRNGCEQIISTLLSAGAEINQKNTNWFTPLHLATFNSHFGAVSLLLKNGADINILDSNRNTLLHNAAESGSRKLLSLFLSKGMEINNQNSNNATPLDLAVVAGHIDAVHFLLEKGADINIIGFNEDTVLHSAAKSGSQKLLTLFLSKGMEINNKNSYNVTPLHLAARKGHTDAVQLLLENGANINIVGFNGKTVLHIAAENGSQKLLALLLSKGMEINEQDSYKQTPLHFAANNGHIDAVNLLLEKGADINIIGFNGKTVLHSAAESGSQKLLTLLLSKGMDINKQDSRNQTLLHYAAYKDHIEAAKFLLEKGADINILDSNGNTLVHNAAVRNSQKLLTLLLSKGMNINKLNSHNLTPLQFTTSKGNIDAVIMLLENGADINILDSNKNTLLYSAVESGSRKLVTLLLSKGMEINVKNSYNMTPLHLAAGKGHIDIVQLLLEKGADINIIGVNGKTVLHIAAETGSQKLINFLLSKGMEINEQGSCNQTPLYFAACKGHIDTVKLLLEKGANVTVLDSNRNTLLRDMAKNTLLRDVTKNVSQGLLTLLLFRSMDIDEQNSQNPTPLQFTASMSDINAVQLHLKNGCNINILDSNGNTLLHKAAVSGSNKILSLLLSKRMEINKRNFNNATPLHLAVSAGHIDAVYMLLEKGADVNIIGFNGDTVLHNAAKSGSQKLLTLFLSKGMEINQQNYYNVTPLHLAVRKGYIDAVQLLIEKGANINSIGFNQKTVLHIAAESGSQKILTLLLSKGMEVNQQDLHNHTPLHRAIYNGNNDAVKLLLEKGADFNILDSNGNSLLHTAVENGSQTVLTLLLSKGMEINKQNSYNVTPLHLAARKGNIESVQLLLEKGANINSIGFCGKTVLHIAAERGLQKLLTLLLSKGMDVNKQDSYNHTPLHCAAYNSHIEAVKLLFENGADINIVGFNGKTILHIAAESGSKNILTWLMPKGIEVNKQDSYNQTPLHCAARKGHIEAVNLLLEIGADINLLDSNGNTLLHDAAQSGFSKLLTLLLSRGMEINTQNSQNLTPLQFTTSKGNIDAVKWLLEKGADINVLDSNGNTLLHNAVEIGSHKLTTLFLSKGMEVNKQNSKNLTPLHLAVGLGHVDVVNLLYDNGALQYKVS